MLRRWSPWGTRAGLLGDDRSAPWVTRPRQAAGCRWRGLTFQVSPWGAPDRRDRPTRSPPARCTRQISLRSHADVPAPALADVTDVTDVTRLRPHLWRRDRSE